MTAQEIRQKYLQFFKARGHAVIPRASLVPRDDPTTLFTGSGMQPLISYLLGQPHPDGTKLVDSQPVFRAQDIEEVGDNRHDTLFEMLGNWSLGDYFKAEQIPWIFEFYTDVIKLDPQKLYVTTFIGDKEFNIPKDTQSGEIWKQLFKNKDIDAGEAEVGSEENASKIGMPAGARIFYYDASKNWWWRGNKIADMPIGEPGGPSSEIFYLFDFVEHNPEYGEQCHPNCDCGRFVEIGNNVLMEYKRAENGFELLPKKNIDFGGGLERIAMAVIDNPDMFKISIMWPIIEKLEELSGKKYDSHMSDMRVIADHLRAAAFLAVDGVAPSNKEQGYVARRLMRRAILKAFNLGIEQDFIEQIVPVITNLYAEDYPEVAEKRQEVIDILVREEKAFRQTLRKGLKEFDKLSKLGFKKSGGISEKMEASEKLPGQSIEFYIPVEGPLLTGKDVFKLYDTYGFPAELSVEEAYKKDVNIDKDWQKEFNNEMIVQRTRSQTASKGTFKGGLADHSAETTKLHTATHLMYEALRRVLGDHVVQRGSNVTAERTRFDFSHDQKVTREQLDEVERIVNEQIAKDLKVEWKEYPTDEAFKLGAKGAFGDKYGDKVKVYTMGKEGEKPYSIEICGGPHVEHTGQLAEGNKKFKILKEEASSAGVRRIKATLA
jgi:alanyl-tRNA synthetase